MRLNDRYTFVWSGENPINAGVDRGSLAGPGLEDPARARGCPNGTVSTIIRTYPSFGQDLFLRSGDPRWGKWFVHLGRHVSRLGVVCLGLDKRPGCSTLAKEAATDAGADG